MLRLGLALLWILRLLPTPMLIGTGRLIGLLSFHFAHERQRIARINLGLCFPQLSAQQRERMLRAHFQCVGRSLLERGVLWWSSAARVRRMIQVEGIEHWHAVEGTPTIFLAPHFVGLDMGGVRLTMDFPVASVYGPQRNRMMDDLLKRGRNRFGTALLISRKDGVRPILHALRDRYPLYYLPDQDFGRHNAIFAPFFGVPASTLTALPRVARMAQASVLPCITRQTARGYAVRFYPAWQDFPSGDVEADTRRMNEFIEARVREMPEQYYWLHRRFKTRPPGEASFYR